MFGAVKYSTGWTHYVHEVRVGLRSWLGDRDPRGSVPPPFTNPPTSETEKTQAELDVLMNFLHGRCNYDFSPSEALNEAAIEAGESWASNDSSGE
jgi:hypothetical protein